MANKERIYLDNAATSWPKPEAVYAAVDSYLRNNGAPAGRSAYVQASESAHLVARTRGRLATLLGVSDPHRMIFTFNGTDSLNMALHGCLRPGDHVITTNAEHNSVLRPLRHLESIGVHITRVPCDATGLIDPDDVARAMRHTTRIVALTHASNVTGTIQPVADVSAIARRHSALLLVDAAQTLGQLEFNVDALGADLVAAPGHKGLLGPLGTGVLYVGPRCDDQLLATRQGGTGTDSAEDHQPDALPEKLESGNLNVAGLAGLDAALAYLAGQGLDTLRQHHIALTQRLLEGLLGIERVNIYGPMDAKRQVGLVSCTIDQYDIREVSAALDTSYNIQVRSGLHCAPLIHHAVDSARHGGTIRFSLGPLNDESHVDAAIEAVSEIAATALTF